MFMRLLTWRASPPDRGRTPSRRPAAELGAHVEFGRDSVQALTETATDTSFSAARSRRSPALPPGSDRLRRPRLVPRTREREPPQTGRAAEDRIQRACDRRGAGT